MRGVVSVLAAALLVSSAINVYLFTRSSSNSTAPPAAPAPSAAVRRPVPPAPAPTPTPTAPIPTTCLEQVEALTAELATANQEIDKGLDMYERYAKYGRSEATEARMQPFIDRALAGAPATLSYEFECHDDVCQLQITEPEGERGFDWQERLQFDPSRFGEIVGMGFTAGTPATDAQFHQALVTNRVVFRVRDAGAPAGMGVLMQLSKNYVEDPAMAACKTAHPTEGHLSVRVSVDGPSRHIAVDIGGTLAAKPVGECLRELLQRHVATIEPTIDPAVSAATRYLTIRVP